MLSEKVLFAMNDMDDSLLEATRRRMGYGQKKTAHRGKTLRRVLLLAAVVAVFLAFGVTAYALNLWGIREMYNNPNRTLPEEAETLIEPRSEEEEAEGLRCRITESLCDASQVMLTVEITCGEEYILAPTDAMLEDPLWVIGRTGEEGTLGEYAEKQGKEILFLSAYIHGGADTGICDAGMQFESRADNHLVILTEADRDPSKASGDTVDATCVVTVMEAGDKLPENIERIEIPFTMTEGASTVIGIFAPVDPDAIPGIHVDQATVTKTALGYIISYIETVTDQEASHRIMKIDCDELEDPRGYSTLDEDSGLWWGHIEGEGSIEDRFTVRFYDWDKQPIGDIVFKKTS